MQMPLGDAYLAAVQNPSVNLKDSELKICHCQINSFAMTVPYSGGFTTTFKFINPTPARELAVRCFTRSIGDLAVRYDAISKFIQLGKHDFLVETHYQQEGI